MNSCCGCLRPPLEEDVGFRAFDDLEQRLLDAFAGHVAGDGRPVCLTGDLVDFVDVDDPLAGRFKVVVGILKQLDQNVFHVFAHIPGLGQRGGVRDGERHAQDAGQRLGEERLAAPGGADKQDVALFELHTVVALEGVGVKDALVVVVHRHGEDLFGLVLPDDVFVEAGLDFLRGEQAFVFADLLDGVLGHHFVAGGDALVADVHAVRPGDELVRLRFGFAAERAAGFVRGSGIGHLSSYSDFSARRSRREARTLSTRP